MVNAERTAVVAATNHGRRKVMVGNSVKVGCTHGRRVVQAWQLNGQVKGIGMPLGGVSVTGCCHTMG